MRRTKKKFLTHYDEMYFTVEFYHDQRELFYSGSGMETAIQTATKCNMRGGICFTFQEKYKPFIWELIDEREYQTKSRIDVDFFKANVLTCIINADQKLIDPKREEKNAGHPKVLAI